MSTNAPELLLTEAQKFVEKYPQFAFGWHNEYIHKLKLMIAERIGKQQIS